MTEQTLADPVADRLRRDILRGELPPGAAIKERDTAARMGVSRTPLREAIRILAQEGLVLLRPARSPVVAQPSLADVSDSIEVLTALELLSGELACARATAEDLARIDALYAAMQRAQPGIDPLDHFDLDMEFHRAVVAAAHNPRLAETHGAYLARLWRVRYLSASRQDSRQRVLTQHADIIAALKARDAQAARDGIAAHLAHFLANVRHHFEEEAAGRS